MEKPWHKILQHLIFLYVLHPEQDSEAMPSSIGSQMYRESKVPYDDKRSKKLSSDLSGGRK